MCKEQKTKQTGTQVASIPSWLESASQSLAEKSQALTDKPFEAYTGDRVAGLTADQQSAFQRLRDFIGGGTTTNASTHAMSAPAQNIGTERVVDEGGRLGAISDYLNPYVENALQPALTKIQEGADARRKQINAGATSAHAFGDARHGVLEAKHDLDTSRAMGETAGSFLKNAFDTSMGQRAADLNRFGEVDKTNAQFGETALNRELAGSNQVQSQLLQQLQAALGAGAIQQGNEQQGLDAQYQEFLRKYQHDPQQLSTMANVLKALPYTRTVNSDSATISPDNSLLGLAGSLGGAALGSAPVSNAIASYLSGIFAPSAAAGAGAAGLGALAAI